MKALLNCSKFFPGHAFSRSYRTKGSLNRSTVKANEARRAIKAGKRTKLAIPERPFCDDENKINAVLEATQNLSGTSASDKRFKGSAVPTLTDTETIDAVIKYAGLEVFAGKTILEMNPGPGLMAERLLATVKPARYIAIEFRKQYIDVLKTLNGKTPDDTPIDVQINHMDGFEWETFRQLEQDKTLDHAHLQHDRSETNPNLVFIATARSQQMDQLVNQWIDTVGTTSWLQKFGRVRMFLFVTRAIRQRLLAQPGSNFRTKGTFVREGTCEVREILHNPYVEDYLPQSNKPQWKQDFLDTAQKSDTPVCRPDRYHTPAALSLLEIIPYEKSKITAPWETFEFIAKTLLMNKSTPLYQQIRSVASGAYAILEKLTPELRRKSPQDMTVQEIDEIALAFDAWPFKPRFLHTETWDTTDFRTGRKFNKLVRSQNTGVNAITSHLMLPGQTTAPLENSRLRSGPALDMRFEDQDRD